LYLRYEGLAARAKLIRGTHRREIEWSQDLPKRTFVAAKMGENKALSFPIPFDHLFREFAKSDASLSAGMGDGGWWRRQHCALGRPNAGGEYPWCLLLRCAS